MLPIWSNKGIVPATTTAATPPPPLHPPPSYEVVSQPDVRHPSHFTETSITGEEDFRTTPTASTISSAENAATPADNELVKQTLKWMPPPPAARPSARLEVPVGIPQTESDSFFSGSSPYCRAYAPCLSSHGIAAPDFVAFIDGLTITLAPSPPIQAADLVSEGLGLVPEPVCQTTSAVLGLVSGVAEEVTSATRSILYLKKVNAQYFGPRGLKVSLMKDKELQQALKLSPKHVPLAPVDSQSGRVTVTDRRLAALEGYIASLTLNVPAAAPPTNVIDRLSAKQVQSRIKKQREKAEKEAVKHEEKAAKKAVEQEKKDAKRAAKQENKDAKVAAKNQIYSDGAAELQGSTPAATTSSFSQAQPLEPYRSYEQQFLAPMTSPPQAPSSQENKRLKSLEFKMQKINLKADERLLSEDKPDRREKIDKERAKKLAEVEKEMRKEEGKDERRAAKSVGRPTQEVDGIQSRRRSSSNSGRPSLNSPSSGGREGSALEKNRKAAAKLRWIVVQNLPEENEVEEAPQKSWMARGWEKARAEL
ncbi:uncharacterized protein HMPREF1541_06461 [Cyphellophora europaea CBS 101466]|uniref:Uncharacterized protein n=1 Tax=Cyphellophora europaea (strain CBS 101466) TaxID=1220924 RepID=W2RPJ6_CYPE1|nr:uncharacterized protein HMPREF1541_06461 [Cyphellophora europaea CBS 101466]ETN38426.1 hypothetical protein HMPREF1541_06461 [Cyphellophora europaea CBS 101466]